MPPNMSVIRMWLRHVNDGFDHARLRLNPFRKLANHFAELGLVRNPRPRLNLPILDQLDDAREIRRQRIATGEQRDLPVCIIGACGNETSACVMPT